MKILSRILFELSKGNISVWIASISFVMSLVTWIRTFIVEHKNIKLKVQFFRANDRTAYMFLLVENKSRLPIAISDIIIRQGKERAHCCPFPTEIITGQRKVSGKLIEKPPKCSDSIPIQLNGLSSKSCIVLFEDIPLAIPQTSTHLNFEVLTNRGMKVRKKLPLPEGWASRNDIP